MRKEDVVGSRALPRILAFTLAACGGRYASSEGQGGGAASMDEPSGIGANSMGGATAASGGNGSVARAGSSSGGTGVTSGGTGIALGGIFGVAGKAMVTAGTFTGSGGASPGTPTTDDAAVCKAHCGAIARICPGSDVAGCFQDCLDDLTTTTCHAGRSADYKCIANTLQKQQDCKLGLYAVNKFCGTGLTFTPMACGASCGTEISGDPTGCRSTWSCESGEKAELRCLETGGVPLCSCWLNDTKAGLLMTTADNAKTACASEDLRNLCINQLP